MGPSGTAEPGQWRPLQSGVILALPAKPSLMSPVLRVAAVGTSAGGHGKGVTAPVVTGRVTTLASVLSLAQARGEWLFTSATRRRRHDINRHSRRERRQFVLSPCYIYRYTRSQLYVLYHNNILYSVQGYGNEAKGRQIKGVICYALSDNFFLNLCF